MRIPKRIKIGGHWFAVLFRDEWEDVNRYGQTVLPTKTITLARKVGGCVVCESEQAATLLHELIHCISDVYLNGQIEENNLEPLAQGMFQVLRDNKLDFRE